MWYLMKIKFNNPKYLIKSRINILNERFIDFLYDNLYMSIFWIVMMSVWVTIIYNIFKLNIIVASLLIMITIFILFFIKSIIKSKKVKLENIEFEKEFNVYSDDEIETRKILNPAFMYRIYDYVNKVSKNRSYSLFLFKDYIYIYHKIYSGSYLEVSFFKSLFSNIKDYVEFYLELKNISELASDLKLSFYDKEFSKNNIIK